GGSGDGSGGDDGDGDGDGSGGGGTGGDGDGEGNDDEEQPESSVGGESCDATLSCEGDAGQCAILRQQKEMRCEAVEQAGGEKTKGDSGGRCQGAHFARATAEVRALGLIKAGGRVLPAGCATPERTRLRPEGGRTLEIMCERLCQAATGRCWLII